MCNVCMRLENKYLNSTILNFKPFLICYVGIETCRRLYTHTHRIDIVLNRKSVFHANNVVTVTGNSSELLLICTMDDRTTYSFGCNKQ